MHLIEVSSAVNQNVKYNSLKCIIILFGFYTQHFIFKLI